MYLSRFERITRVHLKASLTENRLKRKRRSSSDSSKWRVVHELLLEPEDHTHQLLRDVRLPSRAQGILGVT